MMNNAQDNDHDNSDKLRDPEDRPVKNEQELREKMLDKHWPTHSQPVTLHPLFQIWQKKILCDLRRAGGRSISA